MSFPKISPDIFGKILIKFDGKSTSYFELIPLSTVSKSVIFWVSALATLMINVEIITVRIKGMLFAGYSDPKANYVVN
ncbi:MAG: hypothetical protein ACJAWS_001861 [Oleiphilaceae bacterium]|jgi:hypothetical protein